MLESWRRCFRVGLAPQLSDAALHALHAGLSGDDAALLQGQTTQPPPSPAWQGLPVEAACPIGYAGWQGEGLVTVGEVEEFFSAVCARTDLLLGGPGECRWLLNFWDDTPRETARRALLAEVEAELRQRAAAEAADKGGKPPW